MGWVLEVSHSSEDYFKYNFQNHNRGKNALWKQTFSLKNLQMECCLGQQHRFVFLPQLPV